MSTRNVVVDSDISQYIHEHLNPPADPVVARLSERTVERFGGRAGMNIGEDQGRLLKLFVELLRARRVVEVGTFTGMSALWLARGLPADGKLVCLEVDDEPIEVARTAWEEAGVSDRIEVRIGPAIDSLRAMPTDRTIDMAFVDADKEGYAAYVAELLPRLRPGGLIALDNTLWSGRVLEPSDESSTQALQTLNDDLARRDDLEMVILSVGDGLSLIRSR